MTLLDDMLKFWEWYDRARGDTSTLEIERRARVKRGLIGNAYKKRITYEVVTAVARGLGLPDEAVLREAKLLAPVPEQEHEHSIRELYELAKRLTPKQREELLAFAWFQFRQRQDAERAENKRDSPDVDPEAKGAS